MRNGYDIDEELFKSSISTWRKRCYSAANNAKLSYQRALHLAPWQANIYSDIAISIDLIELLEERDMDNMEVW